MIYGTFTTTKAYKKGNIVAIRFDGVNYEAIVSKVTKHSFLDFEIYEIAYIAKEK